MARVDLYFGGHPGDARTWRHFVAKTVTPRFPDGLTNLEGVGQWRDRALVRETAHVIVIYYVPDASSDAKIEAIRAAYKARFRQHSVLRADSTACVGF